MKRKISKKSLILFIFAICLWLMQPEMTVWAQEGKTSLAVSSGSVNIGDTVTVTARAAGASGERAVAVMTVSYDTAVFKFVSCSATYGGGGSSVTATGDSFTVTLKAVASGDSKVSLSAADGVIFDTNEELESMSGSSTTISVKNAAGGADAGNTTAAGSGGTAGTAAGTAGGAAGNTAAGSANGTNGDAQTPAEKLSADNSLKVLALSAGTLSPAFVGSTVKYTATVPNDVTSLAVTATPVNEKAVVESVTGNDALAVGENTISVVVRAENGVTATYTIRVTRQAAGAAETPAENDMPDPNPEEPVGETTPEEGSGQTDGAVVIDGVTYHISQDFTAEEMPADFAEAEVTYHGTGCKGASYTKGTALTALFLKPDTGEEAEGTFFLYDGTTDTFYPYVKFGGGEKYVFSLPLTVDEAMQAAYQAATVEVSGAGTIQAYQESADFYIFLALNQDGFGSYYRYDAVDGTYQRFTGLPVQEAEEGDAAEANVEMEYLQQEYNELSEQYQKEKASSRNVIAVLIFVTAVLLIVIINLLIHRRRGGNPEEEIYEEEPWEDYEEGDAVSYEQASGLPVEEDERERTKKERKKKRFFSNALDDELDDGLNDEPDEDYGTPVTDRKSSSAEQSAAEKKEKNISGEQGRRGEGIRPSAEKHPAAGGRTSAKMHPAVDGQTPVRRPAAERQSVAGEQAPVRRRPAAGDSSMAERQPVMDGQAPVKRRPAVSDRPPVEQASVMESQTPVRRRSAVSERPPVERQPEKDQAAVRRAVNQDPQSDLEIMDLNDL